MFRDRAFWRSISNTKKTEGEKGKGEKKSLFREDTELNFTKGLAYDTREN